MWRIYSVHNVLFILHRVTGLGLLVYLLAHIAAVSTALVRGPQAFDAFIGLVTGRAFFALELLLFACLLFHALNGLRLILAERSVASGLTGALSHAAILGFFSAASAAGVVALAG